MDDDSNKILNALRDGAQAGPLDVTIDGCAEYRTEGTIQAGARIDDDRIPEQLGRYAIAELVGEGGFGRVYRAYDAELERNVAIKVFRKPTAAQARAFGSSLVEARSLAKLDHAGIVSIHDVGEADDGSIYFVSKFIEGETLGQWMQSDRNRGRWTVIAEIIASVAEALQHAHDNRLVHRDIKPGNIMITNPGRPIIIDFGIALVQENYGKGQGLCIGTPRYMSPEQARGEGHLVDAGSDIYSLGVVLYELLVGKCPFEGTNEEVLRSIALLDPPAPRQLNPAIPVELERVCLRAMSKRPGDRQPSANVFAEDLRHFIQCDTELFPAGADARLAPVVPKGLRNFDEHDAHFFLQLVPGARDRDGIPECFRFWKSRIEETDPTKTFRVGLLYGPSGCGKSSFVQAGVVPNLRSSVATVVVEAGTNDTERRVLSALHHRYAQLSEEQDLRTVLHRLREGEGAPAGSKLLIVIDQFEQHLAGAGEQNTRVDLLAQALRQCDGTRVQALLLVRDEFWLGVSKFLRELDVEIDTGKNAAVVDLFDPSHAEKVLLAFGRAYGKLPPDPEPPSDDQEQFLKEAVRNLKQDDKVTPVRLALFAEMFKGRDWNLAELKAVGGMDGLGVLFLEESLGERAANAAARRHSGSAQKILAALLPDSAVAIKGQPRSKPELAAAAEYSEGSPEFAQLLRLLIEEYRLVTLRDTADGSGEPAYQLTHDYLTTSVRTWLEQTKRQTRRGRAEIKLREFADAWITTKNKRLLPSLWDWLRIRAFTKKEMWNESQDHMMRSATKRHGIRIAVGLLSLAVVGFSFWEINGRLRARELIASAMNSNIDRMSGVVEKMGRYRRWINPLLYSIIEDKARSDEEQLHARVALIPVDPTQKDLVINSLVASDPRDFAGVFAALSPLDSRTKQQLQKHAVDQGLAADDRFRAKCALFLADPGNAQWRRTGSGFLEYLLDLEPPQLAPWPDALSAGGDRFTQLLDEIVTGMSPIVAADASGIDNDGRAKRRAKAAVVLFKMGRAPLALALLADDPQPDARTFFIHYIAPAGVPAESVIEALRKSSEPAYQRGLLQALGEFDSTAVARRGKILNEIGDLYRSTANGGIRSSAEFLLKQWGAHRSQFSDTMKTARSSVAPGDWFSTVNGQIMVVLPEVEGRVIAMAIHEVTVRQIKELDENYTPDQRLSPEPQCPANMIALDRTVRNLSAMEYCNLLSIAEGFVPSYSKVGGKWQPAPDFLDRSGYRLPTREEWGFACRAGTTTKKFFGNSDELIGKYAWFIGNSDGRTHDVGLLKPNAFGLFDMLGNALEWGHSLKVGIPPEKNLTPYVFGGYAKTPTVTLESGYATADGGFTPYDHTSIRFVITLHRASHQN